MIKKMTTKSDIEKKHIIQRKYNEYNMKMYKMAGHLADYYIDRSIESDDYSDISSFLIDLFSGSRLFDIGYLVSKYAEFGLNEKIEDMDFDINDWYNIKYQIENDPEHEHFIKMEDDEYLQYMIEKKKKEINK
jgi:hypothetical protein